MNIKVGDLVVPTHQVGKVVKITEQAVSIEVKLRDGTTRITQLTEEQAHRRGLTLEQLTDESLTVINKHNKIDNKKANHYRE